MAWIEVHQSLPTHAKTVEAAALLDVPEVEIVGHVVCLWLWALDNSKDGRVRLDKPHVIAKAARWCGEPGRFMDALLAAGFLDQSGAIHDWDDYTGRLMERRERTNEQTRKRVAAWRGRQRASLIEGSNAQSNALRNAPVTLGNAPTVPNPTIYTTTDVVVGAPDKPDAIPLDLGLVLTPVPKPVKAKLVSHPAVAGYRRITGLAPKEAIRALIEAAMAADDADALEQWGRVVTEWLARGFKSGNVSGMLDWFRDGIPPKQHGRAPPRTQNGRVSVADVAAARLRSMGADRIGKPQAQGGGHGLDAGPQAVGPRLLSRGDGSVDQ